MRLSAAAYLVELPRRTALSLLVRAGVSLVIPSTQTPGARVRADLFATPKIWSLHAELAIRNRAVNPLTTERSRREHSTLSGGKHALWGGQLIGHSALTTEALATITGDSVRGGLYHRIALLITSDDRAAGPDNSEHSALLHDAADIHCRVTGAAPIHTTR